MKQWHNDSNLEPNSVDAITSKNPLTHSGDDWPFKCQKKVKSDKSLIPTSVTLCWDIGGGEGGPTTEKNKPTTDGLGKHQSCHEYV